MSTEHRGRVEAPPADVSQSSLGELLGNITRDMTTLVRQEVQLAKVELRQEAMTAGKAAGMFGGAAFAAYMVALFLSFAAWWALENILDAGLSALVVAAFWGIAGAALFAMGRTRARQIKTMPQTIESAREIPGALRGHRADGDRGARADGHRSRREEGR